MASRRRSTAEPRDSRGDDKKTVPCPACGSQYRVPTDLLSAQVDCKNCGRVFVPSKASTRRLRRQSPVQPIILGGALLVLMIVGGLMISARGGDSASGKVTAELPPRLATGMANPRVQGVHDWAEALCRSDAFGLSMRSDAAALCEFLGIEQTDGSADDRLDRVVAVLLDSETTAFIRDSEVTSARIRSRDAESDEGDVIVFLALRDENLRRWSEPVAELPVYFRLDGGKAKVTGWHQGWIPALRQTPPTDGELGRPAPHTLITDIQQVDRKINGRVVTVSEAEPRALPHLEDTPPELREEIDAGIARMVNLDLGASTHHESSTRLEQIGRPAIPRLLNAIYEIRIEDQDDLLRLTRITNCLFDMTGQRFGFDASAMRNPSDTTPDHLSALKQWYAWWAKNHWRADYDYAIDDSEQLLENEAPPK